MISTSALFVGNGTLLIRCAQAYLEGGHTIRGVMTDNPEVERWARANGIALVRSGAHTDEAGPEAEFDYLFSIANLRVLPAAWIERPRKLAINFHDGPLPRYAGLNATSWALMAREPAHGITWHEMTAAVDAGRIVRQASFPITDTDTALSLNARCYEAGLDSFRALVQDIARGDLPLAEQRGPISYFGRAQRPPALATLDFARPAGELAALVRALDFGQYPNPLGRAKVFLGNDVLLVRSARVLSGSGSHAAGTVIDAHADSLRVATGEGDILLQGCCDVDGHATLSGVSAGTRLPALDGRLLERLAACVPRAAAGEAFWTRALADQAPAELPYPRKLDALSSAASQSVRLPLAATARGAHTVAAFFAWLSALTGQERVTVLYCDAPLAQQAQGLESWLTPWVPLTLASAAGDRPGAAADRSQAAIAQVHDAGPCTRDLPVRLGHKHALSLSAARIGLCLGGAPVPANLELALVADGADSQLELVADGARFSRDTMRAMASQLDFWLAAFARSQGRLDEVPLVARGELSALNAPVESSARSQDARCVHEAVAAQAARSPDGEAVCCRGQSLSYQELDDQAKALARRLLGRGAGPGAIVGVCLERSPDMVVAVLAIMKAGAAYLPLDPQYPADRLAFMIEDSRCALVIASEGTAAALHVPADKTFLIGAHTSGLADASALPAVQPGSPAYVIYTSGSTGRPKGVVVTHANVMNFFAGMDSRIPHDPPGRWLAVTSLSFDISVLELCWTLARGFTVVVHTDTVEADGVPPEFSLFYFASDHASSAQDRYKVLMEGAKFADREGFCAVWTPERHFHAFGGLYPNPAVTSAAIAAATTRVKIRAGSCVLPLHHPIRVVEEWSFVDNISQGRVGVSFASGWQPNDFVLKPEAFADRKNAMIANIDVVRRLWRGESVAFPGPLGKPVEVRTLPRPIQSELPVWVTAAGNPETFQQAGELGCHLLTHLLGQNIDDVAGKLDLYRKAWRQAGHAGNGHVTLMLHTFIGKDDAQVRETVRGPMKEYLRSSVDLIKQAAWSFPTFVQRGAQHGKSPVEIMDSAPLSAEDMDALLEHAFNRYYAASALFGTPERCLPLVARLQSAGVDEIACLIDFGVATDTVLTHLHDLKALMDASRQARPPVRRASIAQDIADHRITHLQCTPSMASMLAADTAGRAALSHLSVLMVGGEALPLSLARDLRSLVPGTFLNMYGPTETTIWSTTCELTQVGDFVPLGEPIRNTRLAIHTAWGADCPALVPGELLIGGDGVAQGYLERPELTAQRFIAAPSQAEGRFYRTGDLVRRHPDGALEFLGRVDHQVKLRGHRIELGEIEGALLRCPGVGQAVVVARQDDSGDQRLAAYVTAAAGGAPAVEAMRIALARELPEVMVPTTFTVLPALPLTPNGKVDRAALPQPRAVLAGPTASPPQGELERTIATIWQDVLGLPQVGASDNFFDLGGHSLLVVQVQRRLRDACGRELSITDMFRLPTIRALAAHLGGQSIQTAVGDGLGRANARRLMRSRAAAHPPQPLPSPPSLL